MNDETADIVNIRDPEIDAEAIMRDIRARIRQRRAQAEAQGLDYEALAEGRPAESVGRFEADLYYDLRRLSVSYDEVGVKLSLTETRLPLIGGVVQRVRAALHQVILYYVNMLARQQARINKYNLRVLTALTRDLEADATSADIEALRQEIAWLRERIEQLESGLGSRQ